MLTRSSTVHSQGNVDSYAGFNAFDYSIPIQYNVILGCPRSGTTFLFEALETLPNSECASGHLFPLALAHIVNYPIAPEIYQCLSNSFEFSIQDFLESISNSRIRPIQKWLTQAMTNKELLQALLRKRKVERFIYKEPFLSFSPELVYNALQNCRIIHIYRDGRDCADSLVRKYDVLTDEKLAALKTAEMPLGRKYDHRYIPWWVNNGQEEAFISSSPFVRAVWMWKEMIRRCNNYFSRPEVISSGRVLKLKYEELVHEPFRHGEMAAEHFGCEMNHLLQNRLKAARCSSVGVHKRRDPKEIEIAEEIARSELQLCGYLETSS